MKNYLKKNDGKGLKTDKSFRNLQTKISQVDISIGKFLFTKTKLPPKITSWHKKFWRKKTRCKFCKDQHIVY